MATWAKRHIANFSIRDCKIIHSFEAQPFCETHKQFAIDCDEASQENTLMLIPNAQLGNGVGGTKWYAVITDQHENLLWEQQDEGYELYVHALARAQAAVNSLAYERRHQLRLL